MTGAGSRSKKTCGSVSAAELISRVRRVQASFNSLFLIPVGDHLELAELSQRRPFQTYRRILALIPEELCQLESDRHSAGRCVETLGDAPDSLDYINAVLRLCEGQSLADMLVTGVLDVLTAGRLFSEEDPSSASSDAELRYQVIHAHRLATEGVQVLADYLDLLISVAASPTDPLRIMPEFRKQLAPNNLFRLRGRGFSRKLVVELRERALQVDPFRVSRVFRYADGEFFSASLVSIRPVDQFYGFPAARELFRRHFANFAENKHNLPLLISSLPGLGKTHFVISYTLSYEQLTLILPEPGDLEKPLEGLIRQLARRRSRNFVIFFDDVDTRKIDWYYFRTHIGGSFALPENIAIVIASNFEFPANISSRGRGFAFPIFDEIACQEMIHDYLLSLGMKNPPLNLVSVIAADYVEEFGQNVYEELSPRTLVRYLDRYNRDMKKRRRMLDISQEEVIAKPDAQSFYEANQKIIDRLGKSL